MLTSAVVDGIKVSISEYDQNSSSIPYCPLGHRLVAKKGVKLVHHFAHYPGDKCDSWRDRKMTNWHSQWQNIVLDKRNIEVCLDKDGNITGHSTYSGYKNQYPNSLEKLNSKEEHIADIINPQQTTMSSSGNNRPLVIEIQHSSMDKEVIEAREKYYQHMIWVFDITPRVVKQGKHNKIAMVDGSIHYLNEKVSYISFLTTKSISSIIESSNTTNTKSVNDQPSIFPTCSFDQHNSYTIGQNSNNNLDLKVEDITNSQIIHKKYKGDEILETEPTMINGIFVIIHTKTKYWFDATKPVYLDSGFAMFRLITKLDKGFFIALYMTYDEFLKERMPEINTDILKSYKWFSTMDMISLIKLKIIPRILDVDSVYVCKTRIIIKHKGYELQDMGLEQGLNDWHYGSHYSNFNMANDNNPDNNNSLQVFLSNMTGNSLPNQLAIQKSKEDQTLVGDVMIIAKIRRFLGASNALEIKLVNKKGYDNVIIYCNNETYNMKDKFMTLGMKYRKGTQPGKKLSNRQVTKHTHLAIANAVSGSYLNSQKIDSTDISDKETRTHYIGKVKSIESKLKQLGL